MDTNKINSQYVVIVMNESNTPVGHRLIRTIIPCKIKKCNEFSNRECHHCDKHCKVMRCSCDTPYRNYGEKVCLNCGKILDFESPKLYLFSKDGRPIEV